jgi:glutathionyl-hydroquinone reductase
MKEEEQKPVSAGGMAWVLVVIIVFVGALWIAEKKTDNMVSSFNSTGSVRDKGATNYPRELEREIGELKAKLKILKANRLPVHRETKAQEKERWEKNKHHLHEHIRKLNILLKDKAEELELVRSQVPPETYSDGDSDLLAELSQGEVAK